MPKKPEIILLVFLLSMAAFFATYKLTESPGVWYDEGIYIQNASNLAEGNGPNFRFAPGDISPIPTLTVGFPLIYLLAIIFKIFGSSVLAARSLMALFIFGLAVCSYLLIRKKWGSTLALFTLALVGTFPPLYGNGKSVLGEVPALFFMALALIIFQYAIQEKNRSKVAIILAGFFAGFSAVTKLNFLVFLPSFAFVVLYQFYKKRLSKIDVLLGGVFSSLPVLVWAYIQYRSVDSIKTIFTFYANPSGNESLIKVVKTNILNFFTEAGPLYLLVMMIVWVVAIIVRKSKKIDIAPEEAMSFIFCALISLSYLRITGWHRYIFPAQIVALWYLAPSLKVSCEWLTEKLYKFRISALLQKFGTLSIVILLCLWGVYSTLFSSWVASAYHSDKTAFWQNYFKVASSQTSFFFYDTPEVAMFSKSSNYYQYLPLLPAGGPFGAEYLKVIEMGKVDKIIVRSDHLGWKQDWFLKHYKVEREVYKYSILIKK